MRKLILLCLACVVLVAPAAAQSKKTQDLIKDLKDKNPKIRAGAAEDLGKLAAVKLSEAKFALPALRAAQKDADPAVRKAVLEALGQIDPDAKTYVPLLTETLKREKDPLVQVAAVSALIQIEPLPKSALPVLLDVHKAALASQKDTNDPQNLRATLMAAIVKLDPDPKKTVPFYVEVLKRDRNVNIRLQALAALGQVGAAAKSAIPAIQEVLRAAKLLKDKDGGLTKAAEEALLKIQPKDK
jgi:HEAT repeat protein